MMRRSAVLLGAFSLLAVFAGTACEIVDTERDKSSNPTPAPTEPFTNETYSTALRVASLRLRGRLPDAADQTDVLQNGKGAYEALIDEYLDPVMNPLLRDQIRGFYQSMFLMGGTIDSVNYNEPPNLATRLFVNDLSWKEVLTAQYCVDDGLNQVPCTNGVPTDLIAGVMTNRAFLKKYGQPDTLNFRRMSLVHQIFACGIYADPDDANTKWVRSNVPEAEWPCNPGQDGVSQWVAGGSCTCPLTVPANPSAECSGDDFLDPSQIPSGADPATPSNRVSKKFQGLQLGLNMACANCHGSLLPRRLVFTPFDVDGMYDPARTISDVETPEENAGGDYCGDVTPADQSDDMDPNSGECNDASPEYLGQQVANAREMAEIIVETDRFAECATIRHYNFVLGKSQGSLGMNAGTGTSPQKPAEEVVAKYTLHFESQDWSTRELLRAVFKGTEFLSSQAQQNGG